MQSIIDAFSLKEKEYIARKTECDILLKNKERIETKTLNSKQELEVIKQTRVLLQKTGDAARERAKKLLENTTTIALQYIFGDNFSAEIDIRTVSGKASADIYIVTDIGGGDTIRVKPEDSCGGGIVDVVSIALRVAIMKLNNINGPIILDEPGKHVSADFSMKLAEFLKYVSKTFDKQVIMVTHNNDLKMIADCSYIADIKDGNTNMTNFKDVKVEEHDA